MTRYIIRRLLVTIPVLIIVTIAIFAMVRLVPGDPARMVASIEASTEQVELIRARLGLDKPPVTQYFIFMGQLFQGDMGTGLRSGLPVTDLLKHRLLNTILLSSISMLIASVVGIATGITSGVKQYSVFDYSATLLVLVGIAVPVFWLGLLLILVFSLRLDWLPATGMGSWRHLILPAISQAAAVTAFITRMTRSGLLDVIHQDYIRTARAKGLTERVVILRHALKNALIPVVTIIGMMAAHLFGGAVLVETVFAWPGIGSLLVEAILARDYPIVQGVILVFSAIFLLINLVVDISYAYLDPRIRYQ